MPQKFCPFAFFSFYVNKDSAEAGGCHHCVEHACALWDATYQQCSVMSAIESIGTIADAMSSGRTAMPAQAKPKKAITEGVSSIFNKLRDRKKLPTAEKPEKTTATTTTEVSTTPATTPTAPTTSVPTTPEVSIPATTEPAPVTAEPKPKKEVITLENIVNPATIDDKLPIGTIKSPPSGKVPPATASLPIEITAAPTIPSTIPSTVPFTIPASPPFEIATTPPPAPPPPPPPPPAAPLPTTKLESVEVNQFPAKESTNSILDEATKQLDNFTDDFSDLLNPPPIDVSKLPIVSKGNDDVKDGDNG